MSQQQHRPGPPYAPTNANVGGSPSVIPDVPVSAVFIALYVAFAAYNMAVFQKNSRKGYKFIPSVAVFGFCMARITTLVLRIAWSTRHTNVSLAVAANIFVNAGILIIYVINLIFAQRILRARQPVLGWRTWLGIIYKVLFVGVAGALIMVITALVLSVYTLNSYSLRACRDVQLTSGTYLLVFTVIPLFIIAAAYLLPTNSTRETFGEGSMRSKTAIVLLVTCLCIMNAGFRVGTAWAPRPASHPAWYHGKAPFYVFNFALEIIILSILALAKIDKRFYVPDGSRQPGDYSRHTASSPESAGDGSVEKDGRSEDRTLFDA
ncbi:hypothetical protein F4806DRAFT_287045 [Annulohypoxylon nitens]|nr:hypothetical protein F4806DRAFT_287045 [Annulohypoxylon nitens]